VGIIKKFHTGLLLVLTISLSGCNLVPVINGARRAPAAAKTVVTIASSAVRTVVTIAPAAVRTVVTIAPAAVRTIVTIAPAATSKFIDRLLYSSKMVENIKRKGICVSNCDEIIKLFMKEGFRSNDILNIEKINDNTWKIKKMTEGLALSLKNRSKIIIPGGFIAFKKPQIITSFQNDVYTKIGDEIILVISQQKMNAIMSQEDSVAFAFLAKYRKLNHEEHLKSVRALRQELVDKKQKHILIFKMF
jgi:hypothetical protein